MTGPSHADSFLFNSDGSFSYTPAYHYVGTDSFTYKVNDQITDSNIATVTIDVINHPPVAEDDWLDVYFEDPGTPVQVDVLPNDYDPDGDQPLKISFVSASVEGASIAIDASEEFIWYTLPPHSPPEFTLEDVVVIGDETAGPTVDVGTTTDPGGFIPFEDTFSYRITDICGAQSDDAIVHLLAAGEPAWTTTLVTEYDTAAEIGIDGNIGYEMYIRDVFGKDAPRKALPGNQLWQRLEFTNQLMAVSGGEIVFTEPVTYVKADAVKIQPWDRTPYYTKDHLARLPMAAEVLLFVDSTNKILGFNPEGVIFKEPLPVQQPFNIPPQALQHLDNMRGPTRTLDTNYFFVNKARIVELYNEGTITPEQYSSVLLITSAATGGMYWDELPDTYERLTLSGLESYSV